VFAQCLGEFISKHDLAKGSYSVVGINEGERSAVALRVRARVCLATRERENGRRVVSAFTSHFTRAQCPPFIPSQITGPSEQPEFQQEDSASGKFAFTASEGGSHKVRA
jgi:hypothetical protein